MAHIFYHTIQQSRLKFFIISYDIVCQPEGGKNIRMMK